MSESISKQQRLAKLRAVLGSLTHQNLVDELVNLAQADDLLLNRLLLAYDSSDSDKSTYVLMVNDALDAGRDKHNFLDYWGSTRAAREVRRVLDKVEPLVQTGQPAKALPILQAVIEETVKAIAHADDSNGELGGCISTALTVFQDMLPTLNETQKRSVFQYLLQEAEKQQYRGWDWQWDLLEMAQELSATQTDRDRLFDTLDRIAPQGYDPDGYDRFAHEHAAAIKLAIIKRDDGPTATEDFLVKNIHLNNMRQELVRRYIQQGKFDEARLLCQEAIEEYKRKWPGLVGQYEHLLMTIAQATHNTAETIALAEKRFAARGDFEYYDVLKQAIQETEWGAYLESLVRTLEQSDTWMAPYIIAEVFAHEDMWDRLLGLVQKHGVAILSRYQHEMERRFPNEICEVYAATVYQEMARASNRDQYRNTAQYLKAMKRLGQAARVSEIAEELKAKYPRRVAMIDELNKIR